MMLKAVSAANARIHAVTTHATRDKNVPLKYNHMPNTEPNLCQSVETLTNQAGVQRLETTPDVIASAEPMPTAVVIKNAAKLAAVRCV